MRRTFTQRTLFTLILIGGVGSVSLAPSQAQAQRSFQNRPCRMDEFYIDVPVWATPSWSSASSFAGSVKSVLAPMVQGAWFCTGGGCAPATSLEPVVTSLLSARAGVPAWRSDGDRRFFRVHFRNKRTLAVLKVLPDQACAVVNAVRAAATSLAGGVPLYVGRECEATGLGSPLEHNPSPEMIDWPKLAMNLPAAQTVSDGPVDLVLIDAGVDPRVAQASDVAVFQQRSFLPASTELHPHGTAMALFLRQTAPKARLHDARVLDTDGHSTSQPLAEALDWALFSVRQAARPMVINLSLGWPRFDSAYAKLNGNSCSTWEAPFGESVRYLLTGAKHSKLADVVAAAGNDPTTGLQLVEWTPSPPPGFPVPPPCAALTSESRWFYPARWDDQSSCFADQVQVFGAVAASGIDSRNFVSSLGISGHEAPNVAPSDHVYATHPLAVPRSGEVCLNSPEPLAPSLPRAFSGSSVPSAYLAGAIARAQAAWTGMGRPPFGVGEAARLTYLTGTSLFRSVVVPGKPPVRALDIARLDAALAKPSCTTSLLACSGANEQITDQTLLSCETALFDCGLEPVGGPAIRPIRSGVSWPTSYVEPPCTTAAPAIATPVACSATGPHCPNELTLNKLESGSAGPQPEGVGCPECKLVCEGVSSWIFVGQLNKTYGTGTTFTAPRLQVETSPGNYKTLNLYGPGMPPASAWYPGASVEITLPPYAFGSTADCQSMKGAFVVKITQPAPLSTKMDYSALRFEGGS